MGADKTDWNPTFIHGGLNENLLQNTRNSVASCRKLLVRKKKSRITSIISVIYRFALFIYLFFNYFFVKFTVTE